VNNNIMTTCTNVKHGLSLPMLRMQEKIVPRTMFVPKRMEEIRES